MPDKPTPARRTFVGSLGWVLGAAGVGGIGYALVRSTGSTAPDPRVRVELPAKPDGFFKSIAVQGRPVAVLGLTAQQAGELARQPGAPPFMVLSQVCTHDHCVVTHSLQSEVLACPCCGSGYTLAGRRIGGPARKDLAEPEHVFLGPRAVLVGSPLQLT